MAGALATQPGLRTAAGRLFFRAPNASDHARERLPKINEALAAAPDGFLMTAGDSHGNGLGRLPLCGKATVAAGVDGAGGKVYGAVVGRLVFRHRPAAIVLTIGTNDLLAKNKPSRPDRLARLVSYDRTIVDTLAARTDRLIVTAVPPVAERVAGIFDLKALERLSRELAGICARTAGCAFVDPFEGLRSDRFGVARPGALADDLHLADYGEAARRLAPVLCPAPPSATVEASR